MGANKLIETKKDLDKSIKESRANYCRAAASDLLAMVAELQACFSVAHGCFTPPPLYKNETWLAEGCNAASLKAGFSGVSVLMGAWAVNEQRKKSKKWQSGILRRVPEKLLRNKWIGFGYKMLS